MGLVWDVRIGLGRYGPGRQFQGGREGGGTLSRVTIRGDRHTSQSEDLGSRRIRDAGTIEPSAQLGFDEKPLPGPLGDKVSEIGVESLPFRRQGKKRGATTAGNLILRRGERNFAGGGRGMWGFCLGLESKTTTTTTTRACRACSAEIYSRDGMGPQRSGGDYT